MSGRQLRIVPYNGNRAYKYYLDGFKVNDKRTLGTETNSAIQRYVNERKVPNLFTEHALEVSYFFEVLRDAFFEKALIDHLSSSARRPIIPAIFAG
jgi:hypothetical protein